MQTEATVFLVDDDPDSLDSMRWLVESAGLDVEAYGSAIEYLDAHDPQRPGCLVVEIGMSEMSGLELQEKFVAAGDGIPIIFVSARGDVPMAVRAMKAGAVDFLEKPVDGQLLLKVVRQALERDCECRRQDRDSEHVEMLIQQLTPREQQIMELLNEGKTVKAIARALGISAKTVLRHRARLLEKLARRRRRPK